MAKKGTKKPRPGCRALFVASALSLAALPGCLFAGRKIELRKGDVSANYESSWLSGEVNCKAKFNPTTGAWEFEWTSTNDVSDAAAVRTAETQAIAQAMGVAMAAALQVALPMVKPVPSVP